VADLQTATSKHLPELAASAAATAQSAADHAGVEIRLLDSVPEFEAGSRLIGHIWSDDDPKAPAALLRALAHAGNFVAGAFSSAELVGVSVAFFALKQFQRSWALARGTSSIRWTADPLVRRNLYFNLCKLGATIVDYYPDFYGPLLDGVNGDGASDRVLLHWELASPRVVEVAERPPLEAVLRPGAVVVSLGPDGFPVTTPSRADTLLVSIPDDIVGLRSSDPGQADAWREAVRDAVSSALADGYRGEVITRDGWLLLTR